MQRQHAAADGGGVYSGVSYYRVWIIISASCCYPAISNGSIVDEPGHVGPAPALDFITSTRNLYYVRRHV